MTTKMSMEIWKTFLLALLWTTNVFCFDFNLDGRELESDASKDVMIKESFRIDANGNLVEVKGIYYTTGPKPRIYVEYPSEEELLNLGGNKDHEDGSSNENEDNNFQPWSILWYVGSFGGLIAFFLVVSCSEWCCRTHIRNRNARNGTSSLSPSEVPPPAYDLFAPPSYDSLCRSNSEKQEFDVYVVPIHTLNALTETEEATSIQPHASHPPSYSSQINSEIILNVSSAEEQERRHKLDAQIAMQT